MVRGSNYAFLVNAQFLFANTVSAALLSVETPAVCFAFTATAAGPLRAAAAGLRARRLRRRRRAAAAAPRLGGGGVQWDRLAGLGLGLETVPVSSSLGRSLGRRCHRGNQKTDLMRFGF